MNESLNLFFAKKALQSSSQPIEAPQQEDLLSYLSTLMRSFREGNLCLSLEGKESLKTSLQHIPYVKVEGMLCYLQKAWTYETHLWQELCRLRQGRAFTNTIASEPLLSTLTQLIEDKKLLPLQAQVIQTALQQQLTLVAGGPGTGKSYTAAWLAHLFSQFSTKQPFRIYVAAPTGKAASHLYTLLSQKNIPNLESGTLHHLLHLHPGQERLKKPVMIPADLLLVDEASMLDVSLFTHLLQAIAPHTRLILLGDANQLPPIGAGTLFAEIAEQNAIFLETTLRTEEATLQTFAETIRQGNTAALRSCLHNETSAVFQEKWPGPDNQWLASLTTQFPPLFFSTPPNPQECLQSWEKIRILCPFRQGPFGLETIHHILYRQLQETIPSNSWWALPILATKNISHLNVYNGMQGILIGVGEELKKPFSQLHKSCAYLGSDLTQIPFEQLCEPELAFVLSVHKSQGSEFETVIALFPPGSEVFGKEALYTAITRSKKKLHIVGNIDTLQEMSSRSFRKLSGIKMRPFLNSST